MRNVLKYFYNIVIDEINEYEDYGIIKSNDQIYIFKKYIQNEEETKYIVNILFNNHIPIHTIIINNQDSMLTKYNQDNYILLLLNETSTNLESDFFMIIVPNKENNINELWSQKLDYYMQQIRELALGKELLINTFNYYIGLAENAVSVYNRAINMAGNVQYAISHRRITIPNYTINYLDPTNMLIDIRVRDIAEYTKAKFFNGNMTTKELMELIIKYNFNDKELNILYARLLYPTYYFDLFEDNILGEEDEDRILYYVERRRDYEIFLYDIYMMLRNQHQVFEIEWLKK